MICPNCGTVLPDSSKFCNQCGQTIQNIPAAAGGNESHQLPMGTLLRGRYRIGKVLGQGGFGITYLGYDALMETEVAIKEFYPAAMVSRDCGQTHYVRCHTQRLDQHYQASKARFLREAKALVKFKNIPEVVDIQDFIEENNTAYIVMEYVKGRSLAQYVTIRGGRLSVEETFAILKPVMGALATVHREGIVHRDIAPDNIILHPMGAKILDFGAVRAVESADADAPLAKSTEAILKQGFAPIEQYNSRGSLGPWTDEYALCATVYYCLTGSIPVDASVRITEGVEPAWESIPGLTPHQVEALKKGMAIRAKDRYPDMNQLMDALFVPAQSAPPAVQTQPEPPRQEPPRAPEQPQPPQVPPQPPVQPEQPQTPLPPQPGKPRNHLGLILGAVGAAVAVAAVVLVLLLTRGTTLGKDNTYTPYSGRVSSAELFLSEASEIERYQELSGEDAIMDVYSQVSDIKIKKVKPEDEEQAKREIDITPGISLKIWNREQTEYLNLRVTKGGRMYFDGFDIDFYENATEVYAVLADALLLDEKTIPLSDCIPNRDWVEMTITFVAPDGEVYDFAVTTDTAVIRQTLLDLKGTRAALGVGPNTNYNGSYFEGYYWVELFLKDDQNGTYTFPVLEDGRALIASGNIWYGVDTNGIYSLLWDRLCSINAYE